MIDVILLLTLYESKISEQRWSSQSFFQFFSENEIKFQYHGISFSGNGIIICSWQELIFLLILVIEFLFKEDEFILAST